MKLLKDDFNDILEKKRIKPVFQPIVSLTDGKIIGYEALSRIVEPQEIKSSEELFNLACLYGKIWELEQLCRSRILEKYHDVCSENKGGKLFLNVNPMVIHDKEFRIGFTSQCLKQYNLNMNDIVFEVTERSAVEDMRGFKDTIRHYKSQGYEIAIDDVGACYSGLNLICDIVPHYIKLDMALIHDIHKEPIKYAMVKSMVEFANLTNIRLIAEGIECKEELKTLIKLGVHSGQGYFLRKPNEEFGEIEKKAMEIIQKQNKKKEEQSRLQNAGAGEFRLVLFKIENYKAYSAYCEKYGDRKGDEIIEVMKNVVAENLADTETMAMLDKDTIVTVLEKGNHKIKSASIISMFGYRIGEYYTKEDRERGCIERTNKRGEKKKYPLINMCSEKLI